MNCKSIRAAALGAALLAASSARAASAVAPTSSTSAATKRTATIGWAGLGLYSVDGNGAFALHAGGSTNLTMLSRDVPLIGWADVGIGFPTGATVFPLKAGAGVRYDKAGPFQLLGLVGLDVMPVTNGVGTGVGVSIMGMALYPLPQVHPNLSAQAQIGYDILSNSLGTFEFTIGVGWAI